LPVLSEISSTLIKIAILQTRSNGRELRHGGDRCAPAGPIRKRRGIAADIERERRASPARGLRVCSYRRSGISAKEVLR